VAIGLAIIIGYGGIFYKMFGTAQSPSVPTEMQVQVSLPTFQYTSTPSNFGFVDKNEPTRAAISERMITNEPTPTPAVTVVSVVDSVETRISDSFDDVPTPVRYAAVGGSGRSEWYTIEVFAFDPSLGRDFCAVWENGECLSDMNSGKDWRELQYWDYAAACPPEWAFGTQVGVPGVGNFSCLERGSSVVCAGEVCRVGVLSKNVSINGVYQASVYFQGVD
jgi:hypothetical protein